VHSNDSNIRRSLDDYSLPSLFACDRLAKNFSSDDTTSKRPMSELEVEFFDTRRAVPEDVLRQAQEGTRIAEHRQDSVRGLQNWQ
jgi:hypothetical protein